MTASPDARDRIAAGAPYSPGVIGWARLGLRTAMLAIGLLLCLPFHLISQLLRLYSPWPRLYLRLAARIVGARVKSRGVPLRRDVFYIANHVSWVDIMAIAGASGTAFVAKAEIDAAPVVGWLARQNRTVFVTREDRLGVADQINRLRDALADNWSVTVFPEGTTTDGYSLLPFKTPMLKVLEPPPPGVMVQPVLLWYGHASRELSWIGAESGVTNATRVLARAGTFRVIVEFLEPFDPRDFPGRKAIAAESRRRIDEALAVELKGPVRPFIGHDAIAAGAPVPPIPLGI